MAHLHLAFMLLAEDEENQLRIQQRVLRDTINPFLLPERRFIELFRFPPQIMREIIDEISPYMDVGRSHKVPHHITILAAIFFFANGSYQRVIGSSANLNLSQAQVSRSIDKVSSIICNELGRRYIKFPNVEEYGATKERFMQRYNFPGVIGCIDGTHVPITKPNNNIQHAYYNRKGFHSKNVLIICDIDYRILTINARAAGAAHDAYVWHGSLIKEVLEERNVAGNANSWLLGDSGYPLQNFLMTPFRRPAEGSPEARYNTAHRQVRSTVERCIGVLKRRFLCLSKERTLHYTPEKAGSIITTCAILHNIMLHHRLPLQEDIEIEDNIEEDNEENEVNAANVRGNLVEQYFN